MPDLACTRCRERKIRCGRERPQCRNCEREGGVICIYRIPAKRVNHLKLLCDSVERLQDRLTNIESHLNRIQGSGVRTPNFDEDREAASICLLGGHQSATTSNNDSESDDGESRREEDGAHQVPDSRSASSLVGPASISGLCDQLRRRIVATGDAAEPAWRPLCDTIQHLCEITGAIEPFPPYSDRIVVPLLPKQQTITAVDRFLLYQDCQTDVFVPGGLRANLERVYSQQQQQPDDDAWAICFQIITLLALGLDTSTQGGNALFGDFARSFLPSRTALVSSRLLTTPRLINVQTLILLSIAAQHFDPLGWAELIFAHACMLARIMDLHHSPLLPNEGGDMQIEQAKVLRALYVRDRMMCLMRGSVSWLPSDDSNIATRLRATISYHSQYADRIGLALIQEDVNRLSHASMTSQSSHSSRVSLLQSIEQQLEDHASAFHLFHGQCRAPSEYRGTRALAPLEFLTTRLMALQHGHEGRHARQARQDARTSCLLLLMAYGDPDPAILNSFNLLTGGAASRRNSQQDTEPSTIVPFGTVLDLFSVPAFFILLQDIFLPPSTETHNLIVDLDLLRRVSACYNEHASRTQANNYHQKVAWVFAQLLSLIDLVPHTQLHQSSSGSPRHYDLPSPAYWAPPPPTASLTWDSWLTGASSLGLSPLGPGTPLGAWNLIHVQGHDGAEPIIPWPALGEGPGGPARLQHDSSESAADIMMSSM
ncbi:hypothetical protein BO71DRAFT_337220 [Aspergillus ellipticus CBS 707.79]|uniref:Zn(2)-C6 fungal-type domain-containing protein n=1 Tax=Aspergillus ellipticus CBS 707.79 TaxID=1448320 RepID=A0A319CXB9_9EURO|nr:hypothetical protein BO71DRAFT_337220 [Aspergillus ellipticus CBS 707.79]